MITLNGLSKVFGSQVLFEDVNVQLNAGCRYGLVGANGSGKSTLLRMILGEDEASAGSVSLPRGLRLGFLRQDHFQYEELPILEVAMRGHEELWTALHEKEDILARAEERFDGERYAEVEDTILRLDGYSFEARAGEILEGLGIPAEVHRQPLSTLSGGFKLRVLLAQVLASEPAYLLLDEPTNHLDILSIRWLEKFLAGYEGCAVVISHDHRFLDNVCSHILDIDYETATLYTGNYNRFSAAKKADRERREAEIARREKQIADHKSFVERFRAKATKARQAQSKLKQMERIVIDRLPQSSRRYPVFRFRQRRPSGKMALEVEHLAKAYGEHQVLSGVSVHVRRGDRLAVIGPNGIGKSTLLKILVQELPPDSGRLVWGHETYPGYFAQDHRQTLEATGGTVESWLWDFCPGENVGFVRSRLGRVLFSGDEVEKKIAQLSGGEAARLVFASLSLTEPNVLLLDEPTNHLDLEAIEALVVGLKDFDGTLIFVSHDRWFVSQLATRILELRPDGITDFAGTYEEYLERCGDDHLDADAVRLKARRDARSRGGGRRRRPANDGEDRKRARLRKDLTLRRDVVTAAIETAEIKVEEINRRFCEPGFFETTPDDRVRILQLEQRDLESEIERKMAEWESIEKDLEAFVGDE